MGVVMKKYVVSRIVDTVSSKVSDKERSQCPALLKGGTTVPQRVFNAENEDPVPPLPVFGVLQSFLDRTYGVRSGAPVRVGRMLNVAV
jgi:hypothetical protein